MLLSGPCGSGSGSSPCGSPTSRPRPGMQQDSFGQVECHVPGCAQRSPGGPRSPRVTMAGSGTDLARGRESSGRSEPGPDVPSRGFPVGVRISGSARTRGCAPPVRSGQSPQSGTTCLGQPPLTWVFRQRGPGCGQYGTPKTTLGWGQALQGSTPSVWPVAPPVLPCFGSGGGSHVRVSPCSGRMGHSDRAGVLLSSGTSQQGGLINRSGYAGYTLLRLTYKGAGIGKTWFREMSLLTHRQQSGLRACTGLVVRGEDVAPVPK